jgi:hypothetical protein
MRSTLACISLLIVGLAVRPAPAQQRPATSVQLPTFSYFGISTSVLVPDRGSVYMGGVNRAQSGSRQFGAPLLPFGNRATGSSQSAMGSSVSVWIHDFDAMAQALLNQPTAYNGYRGGLVPRAAGPWQRRLAESQNSSSAQPAPSVADIRRKRLEAQETRAGEALVFFERARKAEEAGKANVARIYYQMVARRATDELKEKALARLEAIRGSKASMAAK